MGYPFGKDISYTFWPLADESPVQSIPSQTATLYVFTSQPSPTQAAAGTGAAQTVNATWAVNSISCTFTITAIQDPDVASSEDSRTYWVGINFILKTAGQTQTVIRSLELERVKGHHRPLTVVSTDLAEIYPSITNYASSAQIIAQVSAAKERLKASLRNRGYEWAYIYRPDRFDDVLKYMALSSIIGSQIQRQGDHFDRLYEEWKGIALTLLESLKFEYSATAEAQPSTQETQSGFRWLYL